MNPSAEGFDDERSAAGGGPGSAPAERNETQSSNDVTEPGPSNGATAEHTSSKPVTPHSPSSSRPPSATSVETDGLDAVAEVHPRTLRAFVVCVFYANAALLLLSVGPMVLYFLGWTEIGAALFAGGVLAGVRTYQTYRSWDRSRDERED